MWLCKVLQGATSTHTGRRGASHLSLRWAVSSSAPRASVCPFVSLTRGEHYLPFIIILAWSTHSKEGRECFLRLGFALFCYLLGLSWLWSYDTCFTQPRAFTLWQILVEEFHHVTWCSRALDRSYGVNSSGFKFCLTHPLVVWPCSIAWLLNEEIYKFV